MALAPGGFALSALELEDVTTQEGLQALRSEWFDLWKRNSSATPFQSPEWQLAWWKHFGTGSLRTMVLRSGSRLAGIAPLFMEASSRRLAFIGDGLSDHLDVLIEPEMNRAGLKLFFERLCELRSSWDTCDLQDIPRDSPLLSLQACPGLQIERTHAIPCPVLYLPKRAEDLYSRYSAAHRRNLRRALRSLARAGKLSIEKATEESFTDHLEALFRLHSARWRQKELPGMLAGNAVKSFHRDAAHGLLQSGSLRFYAMKLNERIIAVFYGFSHARRLQGYLSGFDPAYARFSPGKALLVHVIEEAIRDGITQFDFLRGNEGYKYFWGAEDQPKYKLLLRHGSSGKNELRGKRLRLLHGSELRTFEPFRGPEHRNSGIYYKDIKNG